jgi:hypothetical protein
MEEQLCCPNNLCKAEAWCVRRSLDNRELWSISRDLGDQSFTVAASVPVCPMCGTVLLATIDLREAEQGPVFDYTRSLAWKDL